MNTSTQHQTAGADRPQPPGADSTRSLIPISTWDRYYDWPTVPGMRHYYFNRHENGLAAAFVKVGNRVTVDPPLFFHLCRQQAGK